MSASFFEIIPDGTHIDFLGRRRLCITASICLVLAGAAAVLVRGGVPMGIDFTGGIEVQMRFDEGVDVDVSELRDAIAAAGIEEATVVRFGDQATHEYLVKFPGEMELGAGGSVGADARDGAADAKEETSVVADAAAAGAGAAVADGVAAADIAAGAAAAARAAAEGEAEAAPQNDRVAQLEEAVRTRVGPFTQQRVEFVGPRVGAELRDDGLKALGLSALAILVYIALRFSSRYAPGAIVAVLHDLAVTGGLLVIFGVEFDLQILAAMLAILGYSLNDTIIIYDRIRENLSLRTSADLEDVLNESVNQTLSRTVLTSLTTLLVLISLYVLGGDVIRPFALAMLIGVFVGTYSSIFIASPLLLFLERRYGSTRAQSGSKSGKSNRKRKAGAGARL